CTGGRHRSVFLIETLKPWLEELGFSSHVLHRDIER
ncbi:MAG: RNase adaptor protein RapZ, partial [Betaproteobacteria bacterium]|nr:RNase adaptor protein RapZ [Betaproteobacteria bacterium]